MPVACRATSAGVATLTKMTSPFFLSSQNPNALAAMPADQFSVASLQKAKKLIQELGCAAGAKQALAALSQLLN